MYRLAEAIATMKQLLIWVCASIENALWSERARKGGKEEAAAGSLGKIM